MKRKEWKREENQYYKVMSSELGVRRLSNCLLISFKIDSILSLLNSPNSELVFKPNPILYFHFFIFCDRYINSDQVGTQFLTPFPLPLRDCVVMSF